MTGVGWGGRKRRRGREERRDASKDRSMNEARHKVLYVQLSRVVCDLWLKFSNRDINRTEKWPYCLIFRGAQKGTKAKGKLTCTPCSIIQKIIIVSEGHLKGGGGGGKEVGGGGQGKMREGRRITGG